MRWLQRFMYGRNGPDQLSFALLVLGLVLSLLSRFVPIGGVRLLLQAVDFVCLFVFFFRVLSRNIYQRRQENTRFLTATARPRAWLNLHIRMLREGKDYRFLRCPDCRQRLRVPRGKGNIRVRCNACGSSFVRKV